MKSTRLEAIAALATIAMTTGAMTTGAMATPVNFDVAIAFDTVAAFTSAGANAATNLASAAYLSFTAPVTNGPNGGTTGSPTTTDPVLAAQLASPSFLSSTNLGLSGTGGTTQYGGVNSFYFFNFVGINPVTGVATGIQVGGFETATGTVAVNLSTETATHLDLTLTGLFTPNVADVLIGYVNTPATLTVSFTSTCVQSQCSISDSGTIMVGQVSPPVAVPEPAALAVLCTSVLAMGLVLRRRA